MKGGNKMEQEQKSLREEFTDLKEILLSDPKELKKTKKKFRMPYKGKLSKKNMRDGYVTVVVIHPNKNVEFRKEIIEEGTINIDDTWHSVKSEDVFFYKNKPMILQPKVKKNPYNPLEGENETYGQKHIMARMKNDIIKGKKGFNISWLIWLIIIGGVAYGVIQGF
jgi:hypothetical protein